MILHNRSHAWYTYGFGCGVSFYTINFYADFCIKGTRFGGSSYLFWNGGVLCGQKLGPFLLNKEVQTLKMSRNVFDKRCFPNPIL